MVNHIFVDHHFNTFEFAIKNTEERTIFLQLLFVLRQGALVGAGHGPEAIWCVDSEFMFWFKGK